MVKFIGRGIIALAIVLGAASAGEAFAAMDAATINYGSGSWREWPARVAGGGSSSVDDPTGASHGVTVNGSLKVSGVYANGTCAFSDSDTGSSVGVEDSCSFYAPGLHNADVSASHTWSNPNVTKSTSSSKAHP